MIKEMLMIIKGKVTGYTLNFFPLFCKLISCLKLIKIISNKYIYVGLSIDKN